MKQSILSIIALPLLLIGCEDYTQDDYQEYYVIESYLVAGRQLPQVRLSNTSPIENFYSFERVAVGGADVQIQLLNDDQSIDEVFPFTSDSTGLYYAMDAHKVLPRRNYKLHVSLNGGADIITANTFVPDTFRVVSDVLDTLIYQSSEQLEITISERVNTNRQSVFIFNTISLDPIVENLTPVYFHFYEDDDALLDEFTNTASGLLNEANFTINDDKSVTLNYPWIAVAFYGDNKLVASTVDDNIYDFYRSEDVQLGGSTLSPGEIQNVISRIEGGIGIFGSMASDTILTFIKPNFDF